MQFKLPYFRLQTRITILVCLVVAVSLFITDILVSERIAVNTEQSIHEKATDIARMTAHSLVVVEALNGNRDETQIQEYANEMNSITNVEFIVVMDMKGIRKSHPDASKIGLPFVGGDELDALKGKEYVSTAEGTLGKSVRAFTPVYSYQGKQIGAVAVGILLNDVQNEVAKSKKMIYICIAFGLLAGIIGAMLLAKSIKKTLFGLEPSAIAKLLEERNAMLESVREGILAVDKESRITLVNIQAGKLFNKAGINGEVIGKEVEECIPNTGMMNVLTTGNPELDQEQDLNGITLLTNRIPIRVNGEIVGAIATFRDKTEIKLMTEQLTGIKFYAEALRAQTHEFMNKLHVILGMVNMGYQDELSAYISSITNRYQVEVGFVIRHIKDPVLAGFVLGKISNAREKNIELKISEESYLPEPCETEVSHKLVTIIGNLIDNSIDSLENCENKLIELSLKYEDECLTIEVCDSGRGILPEIKDEIFVKGYSSKGENRGIGLYLVKKNVDALSGEIDILSKAGEGTRITVKVHYKNKEDFS